MRAVVAIYPLRTLHTLSPPTMLYIHVNPHPCCCGHAQVSEGVCSWH